MRSEKTSPVTPDISGVLNTDSAHSLLELFGPRKKASNGVGLEFTRAMILTCSKSQDWEKERKEDPPRL